jgi:hypothetical protein
MSTNEVAAIGPELEELRGRFDQWRQNRKKGSRVPKELWDSAVRLSKDYSASQLSRVLRLHYSQLKKRIASMSPTRECEEQNAAPPAFVELDTSQPMFPAECLVEFEDSRGVKVRMYFRKPGDLDFAAMSKAFWRNGR